MAGTLGLYAEGMAEMASIGTYYSDLKNSGFTRLVVGLLHIGRADKGQTDGDILINSGANDLIVHSGQFNPVLKEWPAQLEGLKKSATNESSITSIYFSIGGAEQWVYDFRTLKRIIDTERKNGITNSPNNPKSVIYQNFDALKKAFPMIDGIDLDNEELSSTNDEYVIVGFTQMLNALAFAVSFCPFDSAGFWIDCLKTLYTQNKNAVSGFNLQCYAGGGNNVDMIDSAWIQPLKQALGNDFDAASFICPGLWCRAYDTQYNEWEPGTLCPPDIQSQCASWKSLNTNGCFIWVYDDLQNALKQTGGCTGSMQTQDYSKAIIKGYGY